MKDILANSSTFPKFHPNSRAILCPRVKNGVMGVHEGQVGSWFPNVPPCVTMPHNLVFPAHLGTRKFSGDARQRCPNLGRFRETQDGGA